MCVTLLFEEFIVLDCSEVVLVEEGRPFIREGSYLLGKLDGVFCLLLFVLHFLLKVIASYQVKGEGEDGLRRNGVGAQVLLSEIRGAHQKSGGEVEQPSSVHQLVSCDIFPQIQPPLFQPVDGREEEGKASRNAARVLHWKIRTSCSSEDTHVLAREVGGSENQVHSESGFELSHRDVLSLVGIRDVVLQVLVEDPLEHVDNGLSVNEFSVEKHFRNQFFVDDASEVEDDLGEESAHLVDDALNLGQDEGVEEEGFESPCFVSHFLLQVSFQHLVVGVKGLLSSFGDNEVLHVASVAKGGLLVWLNEDSLLMLRSDSESCEEGLEGAS